MVREYFDSVFDAVMSFLISILIFLMIFYISKCKNDIDKLKIENEKLYQANVELKWELEQVPYICGNELKKGDV